MMKTFLYEFISRGNIGKFDHHERLSSFFFDVMGLVVIVSVVIACAVSIALLRYLNKAKP